MRGREGEVGWPTSTTKEQAEIHTATSSPHEPLRAHPLATSDQPHDRLPSSPTLYPTHRRQLALVVERPEVVEHLQRAHERLGRWGVHEVKVHEVVDPELFQLEHHRAEVRSEDLRVRLVLQVLVEAVLRVQPEALAWPRSPRTARTLVGRRAGDGGDEEGLDSDARVVDLLLGEAGVDDVDDAVDCEGGLGDVG